MEVNYSPKPTAALVVDDEPAARRRLIRMLQREPGVTVAGECADAPSAIRTIEEVSPDVAFWDIQLPGMDGLEAVARIRERNRPAIVFVTAYSEYAVRAFEVEAVDYLLKPYSRNRVRMALTRINRRERRAPSDDVTDECGDTSFPSRIVVRQRGAMLLLPSADIDWIEANDKFVRLHVGSNVYEMRERLSHLEKQLDSRQFVRIHRSTIVNLQRIRELQPAFHGDLCVVLLDGTSLTLSRTYRPRLSKALGQRI